MELHSKNKLNPDIWKALLNINILKFLTLGKKILIFKIRLITESINALFDQQFDKHCVY